MKEVKYVSPEMLYSVWNEVKPFIQKSIEQSHADFNEEHMKAWLVRGEEILLVIVENEKIIGCGTVKFINHPNHRVAFITSCGGKDIVSQNIFDEVENWARNLGATKIQAWAKDAQARLYRQKAGFKSVCQVVEKDL